jgi:hypothetical protein
MESITTKVPTWLGPAKLRAPAEDSAPSSTSNPDVVDWVAIDHMQTGGDSEGTSLTSAYALTSTETPDHCNRTEDVDSCSATNYTTSPVQSASSKSQGCFYDGFR